MLRNSESHSYPAVTPTCSEIPYSHRWTREVSGLRSRRFMYYDCNHADPVIRAQARKVTHRVSAPLHLIALPLLMIMVACVHDRSSRPVTAEPAASQPASAPVAATVATPQPGADVTAPAPEVAPTQTNTPRLWRVHIPSAQARREMLWQGCFASCCPLASWHR